MACANKLRRLPPPTTPPNPHPATERAHKGAAARTAAGGAGGGEGDQASRERPLGGEGGVRTCGPGFRWWRMRGGRCTLLPEAVRAPAGRQKRARSGAGGTAASRGARLTTSGFACDHHGLRCSRGLSGLRPWSESVSVITDWQDVRSGVHRVRRHAVCRRVRRRGGPLVYSGAAPSPAGRQTPRERNKHSDT